MVQEGFEASTMKITVLAAANNFHFINPIIDGLKHELGWTFCTAPKTMADLGRSDAVWLEWADGVCINALMNGKPAGVKYILRLHRYELFTPRTLKQLTDLVRGGHHEKIDRLVFVSEHVRQIGIEKFPWMADKSEALPNLIDLDQYTLCEDRWRSNRSFNLLFLGRQSYVKNLPHMLHLFNDLYRMDDRYRLHVVGEISDPELVYYHRNFVQKAGLEDAVTFHGRIEQPALTEFMKKMHWIVCTSIFESQGVGILEAMATGMCPVVYSFPGAENLLPAKYLFLAAEEFLRRFIDVCQPSPDEYRAVVEDRYSVQNQIWRYAKLIMGVASE